MIVELKAGPSAPNAIKQIKEKQYPKALEDYRKNLLLIGISYNPKTKEHTCMIEEWK